MQKYTANKINDYGHTQNRLKGFFTCSTKNRICKRTKFSHLDTC